MPGGLSKMGMRKHARSGHNGKSPKLRQAMKREAEKNTIKATGRIAEPKKTISELFHQQKG